MQNKFILGLSPATQEILKKHLTRVDLKLRDVIQQEGHHARWVYFPETAVLSFMTAGGEGVRVEASMIGNEGATGLFEACGSQHYQTNTIVQIDGTALRAPALVCRLLAKDASDLSISGLRLSELLLAEARRSLYCLAAHPARARFARWLAESAERARDRDALPLTQDALAAMLAARRTTVTAHARHLKGLGIIDYSRGKLTVLDTKRLEAMACSCRAYTANHRRMLGFTPTPLQNGKAV
jgi:CRP-like cAMP-binding protein